jgi:hypothetical protein
MKIHRFLVGKLRNEEWFRFHTEFAGLVEQCGAEELGVERIYPAYLALFNEADQLLELLRKSFITEQTVLANLMRDRIFYGLRNAVKAGRCMLNTSKQLAAEKIYALLKKYTPAITRGGRAAKTAAIDNLLQDLLPTGNIGNLAADIHLLNLEQWVQDLKQVNNAYKDSLAQRVEETAARPTAGHLQRIKATMNHYYIRMVNNVDAKLFVSPNAEDEAIQHFAKALNAYVSHYKALLKGRRTRGGKQAHRPIGL